MSSGDTTSTAAGDDAKPTNNTTSKTAVATSVSGVKNNIHSANSSNGNGNSNSSNNNTLQQQQQGRTGTGVLSLIQTLVRCWLMYQLYTWVTGWAKPPLPAASPPLNPLTNLDSVNPPPSNAIPPLTLNHQQKQSHFYPLWRLGTVLDLHVYLSESDHFTKFNEKSSLIWHEADITFGNYSDERASFLHIPVSAEVQHNASLYAHIFLSHSKSSPNPAMPSYDVDKTLYLRQPLTRFMPKRKIANKKNLILGKDGQEQEDVDNSSTSSDIQDHTDVSTDSALSGSSNGVTPIISYWWPNMTLALVADETPFPFSSPPLLHKYIIQSKTNPQLIYPFLYYNDFWMLQEQLNPINETVNNLNLTLNFYHLSMWKFQLYVQFTESFRLQTDMMGVAASETDEMKRMFLETNSILLGITFFVSLLHSVFDFLAFKNDIEFWRKRKDMEGLSLRAILLNIAFQLIIFLYLLDNETSWMIIISSGIGLLIELWKVQKTVIVSVDMTRGFPWIDMKDRVKPSKMASITKKYDEMAFRYLSYVIYPLLVGYTIYSLLYEEHKSWYSFVLGTLVGFVYTFGFITMTPQLFINYKLKSVAHMPWKTFMYKALNTFIDDLFAFIIKMPTLHRLACLRDDVVFLIYLYQKWIYKEDKRRRNEFGQVGEEVAAEDDATGEEDIDEVLLKELEKDKKPEEMKKNE